MTPTVRFLLVDDNPDFRASAAAFLSTEPHLRLVGEAGSGTEAVTLCAQIPVDLVLLDLAMHGWDGFETTRQIKARPGAPKIILVTLQEGPEYRRIAKLAGADGFIGKIEFTTALLPLIASLFPDPTVPPSTPST